MEPVFFKCKIGDGAVFKSLTSTFATASSVYVMTIRESEIIFYQTCQQNASVMTYATLKKEHLTEWENNYPGDVSFAFSSSDLSGCMNKVKRHEAVLLFINSDSHICLTIFSKLSSTTSRNASFVRCSKLEMPVIISEFEGYHNASPSVSESGSMFSTGCASLIKQKCDSIRLVGKRSSLTLYGKKMKELKTVVNYGSDCTIDDTDDEALIDIEVSVQAIKLIQSASKITSNSGVSIYIIPGLPLKLMYPVFIYGSLVIFLTQSS